MQGLSGTFAFNNVDLTLPPSESKWVDRQSYGVDGNAHTIYSAFRDYELKWDLESASDLKQVIDIYNQFGTTGTIVSCLPEWGANDYQFKNYSGTTINEPQVSAYFQGYTTSVTLLIVNARTN